MTHKDYLISVHKQKVCKMRFGIHTFTKNLPSLLSDIETFSIGENFHFNLDSSKTDWKVESIVSDPYRIGSYIVSFR